MSQTLTETLAAPAVSDALVEFIHTAPTLRLAIPASAGVVLTVDVGDLPMTDKRFIEIEQANPEWQIELSETGELIFMPSTGFIPGVKNNLLSFLVTQWARSDGTGVVGDSSTMFVLPNGAMRSPDVSWTRLERLQTLSEKQLQGFARIAPDFVIELRSPSDSLRKSREKMDEYAANGVRLGWLIDPQKMQVHIYRENQAAEILDNPQTLSGETVLPNFTLELNEIWAARLG